MPQGASHHRRKTQTHTQRPSPAHGRDVLHTHWNCGCPKCDRKRAAVHRLVDSFSRIPGRWIETLAERIGECLPLPMWGTLFAPNESADVSSLKQHYGRVSGTDGDEDLACLESAGWRGVAGTGVLAVEFDGVLLLGIHGAGHSFYSHHWEPLYDALGYEWHR